MSKKSPLVTVILIKGDNEEGFERARLSIHNQDYYHPDGSPADIQVIIAKSVEGGMPAVKGKYLKILKDTDELTPIAIAESVDVLEMTGALFVHGNAFNKSGNVNQLWYYKDCINFSSVMFRADSFEYRDNGFIHNINDDPAYVNKFLIVSHVDEIIVPRHVTVIMNTVNEIPEVLKKAVNSYLNQEQVTVQLILSTVEGDPCIGQYEGVEYSILPKSQHSGKSPRGAYEQINHALKMITGDWLCYASGNDYAEPHKLRMEIDACAKSGKEVCYSSIWSVSGDTKVQKKFPTEYYFNEHLKGNFITDCSLISRRLVDKYLPYRLELNNYAHWDSWLRMYEGEGNVFVYNPIPTWFYVQNPNDMHNVRKRSPELQAIADRDKEIMLSLHRK